MLKKILFHFFALAIFFQLNAKENERPKEIQEWSNIEGKEFFVFVDKSSPVSTPAGNEKSPFKSVDDAFSFLSLQKKQHTKIKAVLNIKGSFATEYSYIITYPTKIIGSHTEKRGEKNIKSNINFGKNAAFIVTSSFLHLENVSVTRRELVNEPRTVPIIYSLASNVIIKDSYIYAKEGGNVCNFLDSNISIIGSTITSIQNSYSNIIEAKNSNCKISTSKFLSSARSIIAIDANNSNITVTDINAELTSLYFAFFARVFSSTFTVETSSLIAKGSGKAKEAIIYNEENSIKLKSLKLEGFEKESSLKKGKLDYIK